MFPYSDHRSSTVNARYITGKDKGYSLPTVFPTPARYHLALQSPLVTLNLEHHVSLFTGCFSSFPLHPFLLTLALKFVSIPRRVGASCEVRDWFLSICELFFCQLFTANCQLSPHPSEIPSRSTIPTCNFEP